MRFSNPFPLYNSCRADAGSSCDLLFFGVINIHCVKTFLLNSSNQSTFTVFTGHPPSMVSDLYAGITTNALCSDLGNLDH